MNSVAQANIKIQNFHRETHFQKYYTESKSNNVSLTLAVKMKKLQIKQLFQATETHRPNWGLAGPQIFTNSSKIKKLHHLLAHLVTQVPEYQEWIYQFIRYET